MAKPDGEEPRDFNRFLSVGTVLRGKYRIDGVIGTGGMAVVYAATHRNRKRFAVKMLHPEVSVRQEIRARFIREGYVANSVEHAGVVSVLDDDITDGGLPFLVMELLEGATVEGLGQRSRLLPLRETLSIANDVLSVLDAAHSKNIIHRDIKPANLFVTRQGQLKVLDFGIARLRDTTLDVEATGTGAALGTPAFMAPEQALAVAGGIDARTDLWAVGATVFTMLSGCLVHPGGNARQVMVRAATEPAPSLESVAANLPAAVVDWVNQALLFDKSARWQSAAAMREALARLHRELFGDFEAGCAKRLFEGPAEHAGTSLTPQAPAGGPPLAVHQTTRSLQFFPSNPIGSPSPPLPPVSLALGRARGRRVPLAPIAVAAIALGAALTWGLLRRAPEVGASFAPTLTSPATLAARLSPRPLFEMPAEAAPLQTAALRSVATGAPVAEATRARASLPRARTPKPPVVSTSPSNAAPAAPIHVPIAAPPANPLQIEIQ
ncbi:MAG: protein kinase [Pseudomonadota bacterium]